MTASIQMPNAEVAKRLKRVEGHLKSVVAMIESGRNCIEIAQQLQAVESAITNAKKALVHDHIDNCLEKAVTSRGKASGEPIREFKAITKYL